MVYSRLVKKVKLTFMYEHISVIQPEHVNLKRDADSL